MVVIKTSKFRYLTGRFLNNSGVKNLEILEWKAKAHLAFYLTAWQDRLHLACMWQDRDLSALKEIVNVKDYPSSPSSFRALVLVVLR